MELLNILPNPYDDLFVVLLMIIGLYFAWRLGKNKQGSESIENYKAVVDSQEVRIKQLEKDFETSKKNNKDLTAHINQLIGQNQTLKEMVALQDPEFREAFRKIADAYECMQRELKEHYKDDNTRFEAIIVRLDKGVVKGKSNARHIEALENV